MIFSRKLLISIHKADISSTTTGHEKKTIKRMNNRINYVPPHVSTRFDLQLNQASF